MQKSLPWLCLLVPTLAEPLRYLQETGGDVVEWVKTGNLCVSGRQFVVCGIFWWTLNTSGNTHEQCAKLVLVDDCKGLYKPQYVYLEYIYTRKNMCNM